MFIIHIVFLGQTSKFALEKMKQQDWTIWQDFDEFLKRCLKGQG
jgi:hypothetical protein